MATLNYAFKEISCKIVYYGCGLCGKTTNLQFIHHSVPGKYRGELVSLATEQDRTLFFDFLPLDLGEVKGFKTKFQLYTVPGQVYYNATRKLVLRGVDGIVFVVDSQRDRLQENIDSLENLKQNLAEYNYILDEIPWVVQYNKRDLPDVLGVAELARALKAETIPGIESVAPTGIGVRETLKGISALVIRNLNREAPETSPIPGATPSLAASTPVVQAASAAPASSSPAPSPVAPAAVAAAEEVKPKVKVETVQAGDALPGAGGGPKGPQGPELEVRQRCDIRWRNLKIGSAQLLLTNRHNEDGRGDYQISGVLTFFGFIKKTWARLLTFKAAVRKNLEGVESGFFQLDSSPGEEGPVLTVWVQDGFTKSLYVYYLGMGGVKHLVPEGKSSIPET
jgi:hypothetical protein